MNTLEMFSLKGKIALVTGGAGLYGRQIVTALQYDEKTFLGRLATETDLMGIIVFLASDASAYITGTNIPVDGGYTAK